MTTEYLKKATPPQATIDAATGETVQRMLATIKSEGREAVERYARDLDGYRGKIVLDEADIAAAVKAVPLTVREDIAFAHQRVRDFAQRQRDSLAEFEVELMSGLVAGQKLIPVNTAGCYVPGGRYAHAASAIMSVCTARVAGVPNIVATSPAHKEAGVNPAILYAMQLCGAHTVLALGGVQAIAALAYGLYAKAPADIIVGPGNRFVAEAKRTLFGSIGIDVVAGPTESAIIADESADAEIVAADLHAPRKFARHVAGLADANSTEFEPACAHPVIALINEWKDADGSIQVRDASSDLGGTMRLGAQSSDVAAGTLAHSIYGDIVTERHRHRYEANVNYLDALRKAGLVISALTQREHLTEIVELPQSVHPWFVGVQFHPEFKSTPWDGHPLFNAFIEAALRHQASRRAAAPKETA